MLVLSLPLPALRLAAAPRAPDPVVIRVGRQEIHRGEFEVFLRGLAPQEARDRAAVARRIAGILGMADAATRAGIADDPRYRLPLLLTRAQMLGQLYMSRMQAGLQPTIAQEHAYYAQHRGEFEQRRIRQILIPVTPHRNAAKAQALAQSIATQLQHGASWKALAEQYSGDVAAKTRGGELGFLAFNQLRPELAKAFWSLTPGKVSIVATRSDCRIAEVEAVRPASYESVKTWVAAELRSELLAQQRLALQKQEPIYLDPSYFGALSAKSPSPGNSVDVSGPKPARFRQSDN